jgi:hypothetical protein
LTVAAAWRATPKRDWQHTRLIRSLADHDRDRSALLEASMPWMVLFAMGMIAVEVIPKDSCEPRNADVTGIRSVPNVASEFQNEAVSG